MSTWSSALPFFGEKELRCTHCHELTLDIRLAALLPALRAQWGKPMTLNSACRCVEHNTAIGGHPRSLHLINNPSWPTTGSAAVDVAWRMWTTKDKLSFARMAHAMGFRVGLHDGFCHVDIGRMLGMSPRPFIYGEWGNHFNAEDVM